MTTLDSQTSVYEELRDVLESDHFGQWDVFHGGQPFRLPARVW